ncbi:hypothetical protein [Candidatus Tisiphia endosymbiont of Nemotelus uliginosus]|uniref:hypothetical protein n=1 Tax=Candidatus Tisiphia endosymbiont of Nemotelus uliginosus TaxID=3077926 RepID=UPI0035C90E18
MINSVFLVGMNNLKTNSFMQLITWLEIQRLSIQEFAKKIRKDASLVHKYMYEGVIPRLPVMQKIYLVTSGSVTANDFYQLSDKIFEQALAARKIKQKSAMDFRN